MMLISASGEALHVYVHRAWQDAQRFACPGHNRFLALLNYAVESDPEGLVHSEMRLTVVPKPEQH